MKKIVQFAVDYPVSISMLILGIILLGYISLGKLSIDLFPEISAPRIFVELKSGERPPEQIEKQFVEGIESQVMRLKGVSRVSSTCMVGAARVKVEYNWGTDMDEAFLDLQKSLTNFSQNQDIDNFVITQHDPNASPVMILAMSHPEIADMNELRKTGENYIRNELIRLEGVADVVLSGTEEKEIIVETDPYRLSAYGLTTDNLVQQIMSMNRNVSGGSIVEMGKRYIIKGTSMVASENDLSSLVVTYKSSASTSLPAAATATGVTSKIPVFLKDVARVSFTNKDPENIVRVNGKRCVGLSIYKETSYNTVKAVKEIRKQFETIEKSLPGYNFTIVQDQASFIQNAIGELRDTALIGAIFSIIVLFWFLRRFLLTLIVVVVLPISIIATFVVLYFAGLSLNIMTIGGLALGAGMLVDNAIVIVENIFRNRETGLSIRESCINGTSQVGGAIISSTITTIVVFLPIVYLHGASGALFKDQAWTVAFTQVISLIVAILIIPMLFNSLYTKQFKFTETKALRFSWYSSFIGRMIDNRGKVVLAAAIIIAGTVLILPKVGSEYIPQSEINEFSIEIKLPEGTQLVRTQGLIENLEGMLSEVLGDKAEMIYSQAGPSETSSSEKSVFQNENTATIKIRLKKEAMKQSSSLIAQISKLTENIPDAEVSLIRDESALESTLGTDESPLTIEVQGRDISVLEDLTSQIKEKLGSVPEIYNLKTSIEQGAPEVNVIIDRYMASMYNLTADGIAGQLKDKLMGKQAGKYENSGELSDITVRMPDISLAEFNSITLKSGSADVPLYEVAKIEKSVSPKQLLRDNQNRIATVTADIDRTAAFDKVIGKARASISGIGAPNEYTISITGEEEKRQDAMSSLGFALILSIVLVYMVMASQFESLIHPFTVLLTIPLAGAGSIWAFFLLGKSLNIMAYIGIIMLGGIAVNNSIILVDAINQFREEGYPLKEAIIKAGQNRVRPILMTSLSSILGLVPLTLGLGESASLRSPLAIALIAGLTASTVMSLVVIPCVYYIFDRKKNQPAS
ncbi:MAG TPA: efflux RND transporter permease subunit [Bacteroidales bacterium]|nr:efflux RND transporter permease subunit [Bacteroidales bacterium]